MKPFKRIGSLTTFNFAGSTSFKKGLTSDTAKVPIKSNFGPTVISKRFFVGGATSEELAKGSPIVPGEGKGFFHFKSILKYYYKQRYISNGVMNPLTDDDLLKTESIGISQELMGQILGILR